MNNVYFTSDLHLGHRKILDLYPNRPFSAERDINAHDKWIICQWNDLVDKNDDVYILGDFSLCPVEETRKILERLHGRKYLCPGNHDSALKSLGNYFVKVQQLMEVRFKSSRFPFLDADLRIVLCHYPLLEWNGMCNGVIHLHGHAHGTLTNTKFPFRYDAGIDATSQVLTSLETIESIRMYNHDYSK